MKKNALEMERAHLHREYAKRPAKDKRCVDALMYIVLFFIVGTIAVRVTYMWMK